MSREDLPKPETWWRENDTGTPVVVSCTTEQADGGPTLVVYSRPLGEPSHRSGPDLLAECNEPVPLSARPAADFLARFTPTASPMAKFGPGAA